MENRLEDFGINFQSSLYPVVVRDLASLRFVHHAENVVFLGHPGGCEAGVPGAVCECLEPD